MGGPIENNKKSRKTEQKNPTNPTGDRNQKTNDVDFDDKTIKEQQNKKQFMGRGDKKTKRGKIAIGTHGKLRPKRKKFKIKPSTLADQDKKALKQPQIMNFERLWIENRFRVFYWQNIFKKTPCIAGCENLKY